MKSYTVIGFGALLFLHLGTLAQADGRVRYSCVSDEGNSVLIENAQPGKKSYVFRVSGLLSSVAACLSPDAKAAPQWDSYPQTKANVSKNDPNIIAFHYSTRLLVAECDTDHVYKAPTPIFFGGPSNIQTPSFGGVGGIGGGIGGGVGVGISERPLPGSHIEYSDDCYHDVTNDVLVDVANPLDSEIIIRNTVGETISRKPLKCFAGYSNDTAAKIVDAAKVNFAQACGKKTASTGPIEDTHSAKITAEERAEMAFAKAEAAARNAH